MSSRLRRRRLLIQSRNENEHDSARKVIRGQIEENFEAIAAVDPEMRGIVTRNWAHLLSTLPPEDGVALGVGQTKFPGPQGAAAFGHRKSESFFAKH